MIARVIGRGVVLTAVNWIGEVGYDGLVRIAAGMRLVGEPVSITTVCGIESIANCTRTFSWGWAEIGAGI